MTSEVPKPDSKLSEEQIAELAIAKGVVPEAFVLDQVANGVRFISIGYDRGQQTMEVNFLNILKNLIENSSVRINTLAIDVSEDYQAGIDKFLAGNEEIPERVIQYDKNISTFWENNRKALAEALYLARDKGIQVRCVGPSGDNNLNHSRYAYIRDSAKKIYDESPEGLTILLVDNRLQKPRFLSPPLSENTLPQENNHTELYIHQKFNKNIDNTVLLPSNTNEELQQTIVLSYGLWGDDLKPIPLYYGDVDGVILIPYSIMERRTVS